MTKNIIKNATDLKRFRKKENLSQRQLAHILKISRNTIATWEHTGRISESGINFLNKSLFAPSCFEECNKEKSFMGWIISFRNKLPWTKSR